MRYALVYREGTYRGQYCQQDGSSGGYPTPVRNTFEAYTWAKKEEALKYSGMFPGLFDLYIITYKAMKV